MGKTNELRLADFDSVTISKSFTTGNWKYDLRSKLVSNDNAAWEEAYKMFYERVQSRFIEPITEIKKMGKNEGEGFSMALISAVLLEFISAFEKGRLYKNNKSCLAPNEYSNGQDLLVSFLSDSALFKKHFDSKSKIQKFYKNIRCGLVHEARTLGKDVIIHKESQKNISKESIYFRVGSEYRLNRDLLLSTIEMHIDQMRSRLLDKNDQLLKRNFILKFDEISGLKHDWYFIYGSNLNESQINERLLKHENCYLGKEKCQLKEYKFAYNKKSIDGTAKANLVKFEGGVVEGVAICVEKTALGEFLKEFEIGYDVVEVDLWIGESSFKAVTCISHDFIDVGPKEDYVSKILIGAEENDLPEEYINEFLRPKNV